MRLYSITGKLINRSMNKITATNYAHIANEISETLMADSLRKIPDYAKYLFDKISIFYIFFIVPNFRV